ncbi:F-box/kelch-repeat protein At3g23880-like [Trifolium pratense]|uniref:F-box/kelch-repeat protein At3g23880-like n=1 Tax=Trifolium pratense TaxID=57577 RepID=UPI001E6925AC|nr:F-box/kelch-repeat protein At3g23880-like [Trifolium pratense]
MVETTAVKRPCHSLHTPQPPTYLPYDVIEEEILCRLPVKLLRQLCCVCKSWNTLISKNLKFAKKHLRMSTKNRYLITTRRWRGSKELTINSYPLDSIPFHSILTSNGTQLDYPEYISQRYLRHGLVDSCDGLLCFLINDHLVHIYNPCLRKVKELPYLDFPHFLTDCRYAFGYDPFIDNYKVIAVLSYVVPEKDQVCKGSEVKVYTLGTDSWKKIKDFPSSKAPHGRRGIFVNGTVNWLTYDDNSKNLTGIVSLHLGSESYQEIPLPDYKVNFNTLTLDVMRDCLCIFSQKSVESFIDVWLMKEYYVNKDSWVKLISVPHIGDSGYFSHLGGSGYFFTKILDISEDDNQVLLVFKELDKLKWVVYDCKNKTPVSSKIEDFCWVESNVYVESLISP